MGAIKAKGLNRRTKTAYGHILSIPTSCKFWYISLFLDVSD